MRVKVYDGTPANGERTLCSTCRHSTIIRGRTLDEEIVHCNAGMMHAVRITFKVTSCSDYDDESQPTYFELFEKAWILQPGSKKRAAAFVRSSDLSSDELSGKLMDPRRRRDS
jgi:hypothetical protein